MKKRDSSNVIKWKVYPLVLIFLSHKASVLKKAIHFIGLQELPQARFIPQIFGKNVTKLASFPKESKGIGHLTQINKASTFSLGSF